MPGLDQLAAGIDWVPPWERVRGGDELLLWTRQLATEIGALHVLAGRQPWVFGRASTHTALLRLRDGSVAVTRLLWSEGLSPFPQDVPVTFFFATADHFNEAWYDLLEMPAFNGLGPKRERVRG